MSEQQKYIDELEKLIALNAGIESHEVNQLKIKVESLQQRLAELQQQSAMQQLEIMRLRESLINLHDDIAEYQKINNIGGYQNNCMKQARQTLSTPTTYDDLMAWHEAQLDEPVAWMNKEHWFPVTDDPEWDADNWIPLYAKKG